MVYRKNKQTNKQKQIRTMSKQARKKNDRDNEDNQV